MMLCDTDCVIDFLNGRLQSPGPFLDSLKARTLAVSTITVFELVFGAPDGRKRRELEEFLAQIPEMGLTPVAARLAAERGASLANTGQKLAVPDLLIAGTALEEGVALITRSRRHFDRIEGLTLLAP